MKVISNIILFSSFLIFLIIVIFGCDYISTKTKIQKEKYPNSGKFAEFKNAFTKNKSKKFFQQKMDILNKQKVSLSDIFYNWANDFIDTYIRKADIYDYIIIILLIIFIIIFIFLN